MAYMNQIKTVCVYCGSGPGTNPRFVEAAQALGKIFAENNIRLVYGGGSVGLMGELADAVLDRGGKVIGVIPTFLKKREHANPRGEVIVTRDMHERKQRMFDEADAFVALPGGVGTLEELVEQLTWAQLGRHRKPILLANVGGFWDPLITVFEHLRSSSFLPGGRQLAYIAVDAVEKILPAAAAALAQVEERDLQGEPERVRRL